MDLPGANKRIKRYFALVVLNNLQRSNSMGSIKTILGAIWQILKPLLASKKVAVWAVGSAAVVGVKLGMEAEQAKEVSMQLVALGSSYLIGQGVADHGKEKAKVEVEAGKAA
jgi:hypothetical protein